jgi:soluble lytic murein transglycosylase-like protein
MDYRETARMIAQEEGVDPDLFIRLIEAESSFRPDAESSVGAYGLTQLMPGTAEELGVDRTDPIQNLRGGARYLRQQLDRFGDPALALAAYNAGPGNVSRYDGIPPFPETQAYVTRILGDYSGPGRLPTVPQPRPEGIEQLARGYQPPRDVNDLYANRQEQVEPLSLYNPYEIAQRFRLQ